MRITNKIMQNNSLYNINNNKVIEDKLNTMMSTGKKITRPSDDPVIAIRALRLRTNVTQINQYYEKNAKDAESWLNVTADALSTVTSVLTDCVKQATKGANKDLNLDDLATIVTQMDALAKEYYSTGNVDYAGRYIFTGYRTDTPLTYDKTTTAAYTDINDEFNAANIQESGRVVGKYKLDSATILNSGTDATLESEIVERTVGRLRLSYDNLDYVKGDGKGATLKYREEMTQPATSSVSKTVEALDITFKDTDGYTRYLSLPTNKDGSYYEVVSDGIEYVSEVQDDGSYLITGYQNGQEKYKMMVESDGTFKGGYKNVDSGITSLVTRQVSTITYTSTLGTRVVDVPLLPNIDQTYTIKLDRDGFEATVNSDGTFTVKDAYGLSNDDGTYSNDVVQLTANGSVHSSYVETSIEIDDKHIIYGTSTEAEIDAAYEDLYSKPDKVVAYLNADTGEVLLNKALKDKFSTLPDLINANTLDMIYDKKEWGDGDIRPENLFACQYTDDNGKTLLYNKGSANHDIGYDVGFAQTVVVNTTADDVFTTGIKRDVQDLNRLLSQIQQVNSTINTLNDKLSENISEADKNKISVELSAAKKAYDYLREELQSEFEHKITSMQKALDNANIAVTGNGTRLKRLDLINSRLMTQSTTFKTLQSENEDIDLAESATQLTSAKVTYEASLMATGKISQTSLMNYI